MAEKRLGKSKEDYLETILMLNQERGWCREVDIATRRGFSKPSVSVALSKLEKDGYVTRGDNGAIGLTEEGEKIASATLAKHRTLTHILEKIGVEPETAEDEACLLEHSISEDTFNKIQTYINDHNL